MLTKVTIRNFKRFDKIEVELGNPVVFIGPNNSGKTSVLQALALWGIGVKLWNEKRAGKTSPEKRPGVTINRRDLVAVPVPNANLLWKNLHVRNIKKVNGKQQTANICVEIVVTGITEDQHWECGFEFDYANPESFYCRPLRLSEGKKPERMQVPELASKVLIGYVPPMSGLAANETRLDEGAVNVRIGEGRTAEVLRNLCYRIHGASTELWDRMTKDIERLFGAQLLPPLYISERGEIQMSYKEQGIELDISSSGRGLQQMLLLLAYVYANPRALLLLDEPDAHLEILRQREIYQLLTDTTRERGNQIVAASHSEVILNEAAGKDMVIAFIGKPHRLNVNKSQLHKSLSEIGFDQYYQAEQRRWILYLEGSTDLAILGAFAKRLQMKTAIEALNSPFVKYVGTDVPRMQSHFHGLKEAVKNLKCIAIFDRLKRELPKTSSDMKILMWDRREIENYLCTEETLLNYARAGERHDEEDDLFSEKDREKRENAMRDSISEVIKALETLEKGSPWDADTKVSDEFLGLVFQKFFKKLKLPYTMNKGSFYELVDYVPLESIDAEISEKLNAIAEIADSSV